MNQSIYRFMAVTLVTVGLTACTSSGGIGMSGSGAAQSEVEIIDGDAFTATWQQSNAALVRLTYDATVPLSDGRAMEIVQLITGCSVTGAVSQTEIIGGLTSMRIPADCTVQPTVTETVADA